MEKLRNFPTDPAFRVGRFWGPATDRSGQPIPDAFKMKWHNLGPGRVQLRLSVAVLGSEAYLCRAYVKASSQSDKAEAARLRRHIQFIRQGNWTRRGTL